MTISILFRQSIAIVNFFDSSDLDAKVDIVVVQGVWTKCSRETCWNGISEIHGKSDFGLFLFAEWARVGAYVCVCVYFLSFNFVYKLLSLFSYPCDGNFYMLHRKIDSLTSHE